LKNSKSFLKGKNIIEMLLKKRVAGDASQKSSALDQKSKAAEADIVEIFAEQSKENIPPSVTAKFS